MNTQKYLHFTFLFHPHWCSFFLKQLVSSFEFHWLLWVIELNMAGKVMQAVQYDSYGGGAAGLKVILFSFYHFFFLF